MFLTIAAIHADSGPADLETARSAARHALSLADELGVRPLVARGALTLAHVSRRAGATAEADEHLALAAAMFTEMGMNYWLERAR